MSRSQSPTSTAASLRLLVGNRANLLRVITKRDCSNSSHCRPPSFLPHLATVYLEDVFLKNFLTSFQQGREKKKKKEEEYIVCLNTQKRVEERLCRFIQNTFQLRFGFFNYGSGFFKKNFFLPNRFISIPTRSVNM